MNFRTIEQILDEQPSIERKMKFKGNTLKLTNTIHDLTHGEYKDLTCYTYENDEEQQKLLLYVNKGKIVYAETE